MVANVTALHHATGDSTQHDASQRAAEMKELIEEEIAATKEAAKQVEKGAEANKDAEEAEAAASATVNKVKSSKAASSSDATAPLKASALIDDSELTESDLQYLDEDTKSRTKHNKRMRQLVKDGQLKQERFIRKHMKEFRSFLTKKMRRKYEDTNVSDDENDVDEQKDGQQHQQQQQQQTSAAIVQPIVNVQTGADAMQPIQAPTDGTNIGQSSSAASDANDISLPKSKAFTKQPPYIINGEMREYQIQGLNWLINRHDNCVGGILGDEMGLGKSLQTIAFLSYLKYECGITGPHLVVAPLSVLSAWMTEFKRWSPGLKVVRYHGPLTERRRLQNDEAAFGNFDVILTTVSTH